jgi:hypothetical protein
MTDTLKLAANGHRARSRAFSRPPLQDLSRSISDASKSVPERRSRLDLQAPPLFLSSDRNLGGHP